MSIEKDIFSRTELLLGQRFMEAMAEKRVILFGVGGVGSWVAEGLIRSGIRNLTIVDSDCVCASNVNRQMMATCETIGQVKVDALKKHLLTINPNAEIQAIQEIYSEETAEFFHIETYDYIIDAIDSLENKALLIRNACETKATFYSSMGAALKVDPTRIKVAEFWKVKGCPLARAVRQKFKKQHLFPKKKFLCVFSDELRPNLGAENPSGATQVLTQTAENQNPDLVGHDWNTKKAAINGSLVHITGIFGLTISGLIIEDIERKCKGE